ncbi:MAG: hypothetical protein R3F20_06290 [Planctomycetota bacterium]
MERRDFMGGLASLPLLFGAGRLATSDARATGSEDRDSLAIAFERMKAHDVPGLVIAVPEDPGERRALGEALLALTEGTAWFARERGVRTPPASAGDRRRRACEAFALLASCVVVCVEAPEITRRWDRSDACLALDSAGRPVRGLTANEFSDRSLLIPKLLHLVHGEKYEELSARVARRREDFSAGFLKTLDEGLARLAASTAEPPRTGPPSPTLAETRADLELTLLRHPPTVSIAALALLEAKREHEFPGRGSALRVWLGDRAASAGARPLGTSLPLFASFGCGLFERVEPGDPRIGDDPAVECGMAHPGPTGGRYLDFVGRAR